MNVITLGTMDLFHAGHLILLQRCRKLAGDEGKVIVGLNTDEFIFKYKGKYPIMNFKERYQMLSLLSEVDYIIPNDQPDGTIKDVVLETEAHLIVIGSDWGRKDYLKQIGLTWEWLEENNVSLMYVPYTYSVSSTMIKERLCPPSPLPLSATTA